MSATTVDMARFDRSGPALMTLEVGGLLEPFAHLERVLCLSAGTSRRVPLWGGISLSGNGTLAWLASLRNSDGRLLAHHQGSTVAAFKCRPELSKKFREPTETSERSSQLFERD